MYLARLSDPLFELAELSVVNTQGNCSGGFKLNQTKDTAT